MSIFLLLLLLCSLISAKCPPNSFCFLPENSTDTNISISCVKKENMIRLKWTTPEEKSILKINNGLILYKFECGFNSTDLPFNAYKVDVLNNGNVTSCQTDFHNLNSKSFLKTNQLTYLHWNKERSRWFKLEDICDPPQDWTKQFKKLLVKAHAILMLLGWLFFIPTGFLFARFGKQIFQNQKLVGMPVWFQIHRTSTFLGVCCICTSILCIFVSTGFTWKGTGSQAWYWSQWHTDMGTISTVLAVSQPLNSLLRCPPSNSQRRIFNWSHRIVGMASYTFAVAAIYIAAANYRKTWSEPTLEIALTSIPTVLCFATAFMVFCLERRQKKRGYKEVEMNEKPTPEASKPSNLFQISWIFTCVGICLGCATSLSLLVANGFKND